MSIDEAIEILENTSFFGKSVDDIDTALDMAIGALREKQDLRENIAREREQAYLRGWEDARK